MTPAGEPLRLTLVRHGHAEGRAAGGGTDFDRALDRKGRAEAAEMGRRCLELGLVPQLLRASAALRARQTAASFARVMSLDDAQLQFERELYLAEAQALLAAVRDTDPDVRHLMLVGHNPGMAELAQQFAPRARLKGFETAATCTFSLPYRSWHEVRFGEASHLRYDAPGRFFDAWG